MARVFDRQMEQFQNKVQQNINLADDEIARLSNYLSILQADIADVQDQLTRANIKNNQLSQEQSGRDIRSHANAETVIARLRSEHHSFMQGLQDRQSQEINALHHSFEEAITGLEKMSMQKIATKVGPIEGMIHQAKGDHKRIQDSIGAAEQSLQADALTDLRELQTVEHRQQQRLETTVQARTQERLESLIQAKGRLSDCVATLEEMERNHASRMATFKTRLETMDARYREKIQRDTERHNRMTAGVKRKITEFDNRGNALQKTASKIERHHKLQIETAVRDGEYVKADVLAAEARTQASSQESAKVQQWTARLEELKQKLQMRENELLQARNQNDGMKREVARLQHEARIAKRVTPAGAEP
jgi:chromosome segregation ATPase